MIVGLVGIVKETKFSDFEEHPQAAVSDKANFLCYF